MAITEQKVWYLRDGHPRVQITQRQGAIVAAVVNAMQETDVLITEAEFNDLINQRKQQALNARNIAHAKREQRRNDFIAMRQQIITKLTNAEPLTTAEAELILPQIM